MNIMGDYLVTVTGRGVFARLGPTHGSMVVTTSVNDAIAGDPLSRTSLKGRSRHPV